MATPDISEFTLDAYGHLSYCVGFSDECDPEPEPAMVVLAKADQMTDEELELAQSPRNCGDWLACVDFDRKGDYVAYHVVVNSDSGGFIETTEQGVLTLEEARRTLPGLLDHMDDIASEQLVSEGVWFTKEEREDCLRAIGRWERSVKNVLGE